MAGTYAKGSTMKVSFYIHDEPKWEPVEGDVRAFLDGSGYDWDSLELSGGWPGSIDRLALMGLILGADTAIADSVNPAEQAAYLADLIHGWKALP